MTSADHAAQFRAPGVGGEGSLPQGVRLAGARGSYLGPRGRAFPASIGFAEPIMSMTSTPRASDVGGRR